MQEVRKSQNQDLRAHRAWSINSGKMEFNPGVFPDFRRLRAAASSSGLKGSEILWPSGVLNLPLVGQLLVDELGGLSVPGPVCPVLQFNTSCEAMEFAETGHRREERPDLPVSLLMVPHALRLEFEKSIKLTASCHRSCFFCFSRDGRHKAALSVPTGAAVKEQ